MIHGKVKLLSLIIIIIGEITTIMVITIMEIIIMEIIIMK